MQVMVDSNILLSALLFPNGTAAKAFEKCIQNYDLIICTYVIDECKRVIRKKFPKHIETLDSFLQNLAFELVYTPTNPKPNLFEIRDKNDYPILYTAIKENVDLFLTGDKDYYDIIIEKPIIVSPSIFLEKY